MRITNDTAEGAVFAELGQRLARARLAANRTQLAVAEEAGVSLRTLQHLEDGHPTATVSLVRTLRALGLLAGLDLVVAAAEPSPIELLGTEQGRRRRATGRRQVREQPPADGPWQWGDERR